MKTQLFKFAALVLSASAVLPSSAHAFVIDFDSVAVGAPGTAAAPAGVSFLPAVFDFEYDSFGDPIPGSEAWRVDSLLDPNIVTVENPASSGWGAAPSGSNALDARFQPTLMQFSTLQTLTSFAVTLDNSTFFSGNFTPGANDLLILGTGGAVLASIAVDQLVPGFVASWSGSLSGVSSILLSSGAYYDNFDVAAAPVPVPAAIWLLGSAVAGLGAVGRRSRKS